MNKRQLIDQILRLNPTATAHFLGQFDAADLTAYLNLLESLSQQTHRPATARSGKLRMVC